ncbi:hypothetical protein Goklo_014519 [Gossypium klotzschianum]|uniref:CCHC-type domain-containing protein n=1 Tax=Gossypium klotzschianum TaxID=34286 RepID=A0A7J8U8H9_9ROSI|nr:hypothetical protein [Gossypium klotzschianum]
MANGTVERVEYEALPWICFDCGRYGHMKTLCPLFVDKLDHSREKEVASAGKAEGKEKEAFGPWMVVERKLRRVSNKKRNPKTKNPEKDLFGSRFNILEEERELDVEISVDFQGVKFQKWDFTRNKGNADFNKIKGLMSGSVRQDKGSTHKAG